MNEFMKSRHACLIGVKAFQNVRASLQAFERLCGLLESDDHLLISSIFHEGVIRYTRPFSGSQTATGPVQYSTKKLKKIAGFSPDLHKHLLEIRNTLLAHDDFEQIEPRLLLMGFTLADTDFFVPASVAVSNKCLSYPADLVGAQKMRDHVKSALQGIELKLTDDLGHVRRAAIDHPEQRKNANRYSKSYGKEEISPGGSRLHPPDITNDPWLNSDEPDFSTVHSGYRYEGVTFNREFKGPERIKLPNGYVFEIKP